MFDIYLTEELVKEVDPRVRAVYGRIHLGQHSETFVASLLFWSPHQYQHHWVTALKRIISGEAQSALITSYVPPDHAKYLLWWPLYREKELVHVQNHMLFFDQLHHPFSIEQFWRSVGQRKTRNAEGLQISEWTIPEHDIELFMEGARNQNSAEGNTPPSGS